MHFLATYWWVFLIAAASFVLLAFILQWRKMNSVFKKINTNASFEEMHSFIGSFFFSFIASILGAGVSFILFIIGVIANLTGR